MKQTRHNETDTNFGWWTDKPERSARSSNSLWKDQTHARRGASIWWKSGLIIGLMFAFGWSLKSLAGW